MAVSPSPPTTLETLGGATPSAATVTTNNPSYKHSPSTSTTSTTNTNLLSLPPELQLLIATNLGYPDLLSLKLTHPHFVALLPEFTIYSRINWVLERAALGLPFPYGTQCSFTCDRGFVANKEVTEILRRRRRHLECVECAPARDHAVKEFGSARGARLCLVTRAAECPRIGELEDKRRRYRHSWGGRLASVLASLLAVLAWLWRWLDAQTPWVVPRTTVGIYPPMFVLWLLVIAVSVIFACVLHCRGVAFDVIYRGLSGILCNCVWRFWDDWTGELGMS